LFLAAIAVLLAGCGGKGVNKQSGTEVDTISVPDTGYTGLKQFMSGPNNSLIVSEVNFKNGLRHGLTKTFYQNGRLQRTFWYEYGLRQDSSCWYYMGGQVFRTTPYRNDTVDGIQKQYYRTGELKAKLGYSKGCRTLFFEEYTRDGKLVKGYPEVVVKTEDSYAKNGTYKITLEPGDKKTDMKFFRGDLFYGLYDTTQVERIKTVGNAATINLRKSGSQQPAHVGIIAEILTNYGNRLLVCKKIDLPYSDLK
jgi:antitoxin component YwqK of YwqJK toxin-antitoxin module